jgi:hypothetical protein
MAFLMKRLAGFGATAGQQNTHECPRKNVPLLEAELPISTDLVHAYASEVRQPREEIPSISTSEVRTPEPPGRGGKLIT